MGVHDKNQILEKLKLSLPTLRNGEFPVKRVGLFGSVAKGVDTSESDIDIMIEFYDDDDTTVTCGCSDARKILLELIGNLDFHVTDYPLEKGGPPELIWIEENAPLANESDI